MDVVFLRRWLTGCWNRITYNSTLDPYIDWSSMIRKVAFSVAVTYVIKMHRHFAQLKLRHGSYCAFGKRGRRHICSTGERGRGIGKALVDKAGTLHGYLVVEVFKENSIGHNFYSKYGFESLEEKLHEPTGQ